MLHSYSVVILLIITEYYPANDSILPHNDNDDQGELTVNERMISQSILTCYKEIAHQTIEEY